jgi:DNA repair exonuclease SbcCD ATPase subunit
MRLWGLEISGFRGFGGSYTFDLSADAIILGGANGQGKTSFFDAVLWVVTGSIPRLRAEKQAVVSLYSATGQCRVGLICRDHHGKEVRIDRSFDGSEQHLQVTLAGAAFRGAAAEAKLVDVFWPAATYTAQPNEALAGALTRAVYLQQDLLRQFIESDSDQDRFNAIGELLGVGRVTELQVQLERARVAWSKATNLRAGELAQSTARLESLTQKHSELKSAAMIGPQAAADWARWWSDFRRLGGDVTAPESAADAGARAALANGMRQLQAIRESALRRAGELELLVSHIERDNAQTPDLEEIRRAVTDAETRVRAAQEQLAAVERTASEERAAQLAARDRDEQLRALAQLALGLLDEVCPVCAQQYDAAATRTRLHAILAGVRTSPQAQNAVQLAAESLRELEPELQALQSRLRESEQTARAAEIAQRQIAERWARLIGDGSSPERAALRAELTRAQSLAEAAVDAGSEGERLALLLLRVSEQAREAELASQVLAVGADVRQKEDDLRHRERTWRLASEILDGLREASSQIVSKELERIGPVLQRVYARVDPHPALNSLSLLASFQRGRGRVSAILRDTTARVHSSAPGHVLSSSQMNALAVCVFLTLNLTVPRLPFSAALLDDPIQSLDDINLLGLIDLLRRTCDQRQLLVSTHDNRFARLLERKLRPVKENHRTSVITFSGWRRTGPVVTHREVATDARRLRIAV